MSDFVRFMSMVTVPTAAHECWQWNGATSEDGYGYFRVSGKTVKAHRWLYQFVVASIGDGLVLRHRCDNPACVNPDHLEPGSILQNVQDAIERGRRVDLQGAAHGRAKISDADVVEIRRRASLGESCRRISADYPISKSQIERIVNRTKWSHLP